MKNKICKIIYFNIILLFSCENTHTSYPVKKDVNHSSLEKEKVPEINIQELEKKINSHNTFFLSYWAGMTKNEVNEVTQYLKEKEILQHGSNEYYKKGTLRNDNDKERSCFIINTNNNIYYMELGFMYNVNSELENIWLAIENYELNTVSNFTKLEYDEIIELYSKKYGKPIKDEAHCFGCHTYTFLKNNIRVGISYSPSNFSEQVPLSIMYSDIDYDKASEKKIQERRDKENKEREKIIENQLKNI